MCAFRNDSSRHVLRLGQAVSGWWGPSWHPIVDCKIDLRVGGSWRYTSRGDDGEELSWYGVYQHIQPPERLVTTEIFAPSPDTEVLTITTLTETHGIPTVQVLVKHQNRANRDGHVHSGMKEGLQEIYNRLDEFLIRFDSPLERFRRVAAHFGTPVVQVPENAWSNVSPCEGWTARDVVIHLLTWVPSVLARSGMQFTDHTDYDEDLVSAWEDFTITI